MERLHYRIRLVMFGAILLGLGVLGAHAKPHILLLWSTANYVVLIPLVICATIMVLFAAYHFGDALEEMKSK